MTAEGRGRRAGQDFRHEIDDLTATDPGRASFARFEAFRRRKQRNPRIGAGIFAGAIAVVAVVLVAQAIPHAERGITGAPTTGGRILYGDWDPRAQRADWYTVSPDGSSRRDLDLSATCALWLANESRILITNDAALGPGSPLRPAIVEPDGTGLRPLDATKNPILNLGCGDVSPDGRRIALEGFGQNGHEEVDGIYSVRASDGGDLVRLISGPVSPPRYSPDGTLLSYFDSKQGVSPTGSGALLVIPSTGGDPVRITPWGFAFDDHEWSPDGRWIVFQRPYGQLYLVRPDGSDLRRIPVELPAGAGALNPSWSPDGEWIVFSLQRSDAAGIAMVRIDGTGLRDVVSGARAQLLSPDWAAPPASP
jgi:dipeptidyl aminopeptidase/acylaminoacyl peptidase